MQEETSNGLSAEVTATAPEANNPEPSNPATEPQTEQPLYAGKYKSPEDLEKAYQEANAANTKMAQELASLKNPPLPEEKQARLDELKELGFVTKKELDNYSQVQERRQKEDKEIESLGLNEDQARILKNYAKSQTDKSMTECWEELSALSTERVVTKKTTIKPKPGSRKGFTKLAPDQIVKLSPQEYEQYRKDLINYHQS